MRRISVIGMSGAGKTTFARELAMTLGLPHVELDAVHWQPRWTPTPPDQFAAAVRECLSGDAWVVDGNYSRVRDFIWSQADTLIWLDYSMTIVVGRILRRTLHRWLARTMLWNGNRESMWDHLFTENSIFLWVINRWRIQRRDFPGLLREQRRVGKRIVRLRTPGEARAWLATISQDSLSTAARPALGTTVRRGAKVVATSGT